MLITPSLPACTRPSMYLRRHAPRVVQPRRRCGGMGPADQKLFATPAVRHVPNVTVLLGLSPPCFALFTKRSHVDVRRMMTRTRVGAAQLLCAVSLFNCFTSARVLACATGVKYQRQVHKQKLHEEAVAAAADTSAHGSTCSDFRADGGSTSGRGQRSAALAGRGSGAAGPPNLTRQSATRPEPHADDSDLDQPTQQPARKARQTAPGGAQTRRSPFLLTPEQSAVPTANKGARKARTSGAARRAVSAANLKAAAKAARDAATIAAVSQFEPTAAQQPAQQPKPQRLDGLQMQKLSHSGSAVTMPDVTVMLQPVTRAQQLWQGAQARPSVALCAYDSTASHPHPLLITNQMSLACGCCALLRCCVRNAGTWKASDSLTGSGTTPWIDSGLLLLANALCVLRSATSCKARGCINLCRNPLVPTGSIAFCRDAFWRQPPRCPAM